MIYGGRERFINAQGEADWDSTGTKVWAPCPGYARLARCVIVNTSTHSTHPALGRATSGEAQIDISLRPSDTLTNAAIASIVLPYPENIPIGHFIEWEPEDTIYLDIGDTILYTVPTGKTFNLNTSNSQSFVYTVFDLDGPNAPKLLARRMAKFKGSNRVA